MAFAVHIPWYATGFRKDDLAAALAQISELSIRYGATRWDVYQSHDDLYRFLQIVEFESKADWESYWYGEDFQSFRAATSSWYQVPVLYTFNDVVSHGTLAPEPAEVG
jgi:quinol monooxygenase YgiN